MIAPDHAEAVGWIVNGAAAVGLVTAAIAGIVLYRDGNR